MKILHFAPDDKFTPSLQRIYEEALPGSSRYLILRTNDSKGTFVRPSATVRFVPAWYWFSPELKRDLSWADCIVIHYLTRRSARAAALAPPGKLVVWQGWGGDYYDLLDGYADRLHLPLTEALLGSSDSRGARLRSPHFRGLRELLLDFLFRNDRRQALRRFDLISMMPEEFRLLQRSHPEIRARFHQLSYTSAEESFMPGPESMTGPDLLVGSSATPTNNHLDTFEILRGLELGERRVVVPLSYGDADYAREICRRGVELFGDRFVPMLDYLPPTEYFLRIERCGYVFMNQIRQQGVGNISAALLKGAKVFLRPENLVYSFYQERGAVIFPFPQTDSIDTEDTFRPLEAAERDRNRKCVTSYWSKSSVLDQTRALGAMVKSS